MVDDLVMQLVGLRYTEPDMTISYPGFLYLLMKLESMIRKGGRWGKDRGDWLGTLSQYSNWMLHIRNNHLLQLLTLVSKII